MADAKKGIWVWVLWLVVGAVLLVSAGLPVWLLGQRLTGFALAVHVGGGALFALLLVVLLLVGLRAGLSGDGFRPTAWLALSLAGLLGAGVIGTAVVNLFPWLGTHGQHRAMYWHEVVSLILTIAAPVCLFIYLRGIRRKEA